MDQNTQRPVISINIATYNRGHFLKEAIDSVLSQTFTDWEMIIVDDASTDNTKEVVEPYLIDQRIKYVRNEVNKNISFTRNRGLELSSSPYIAILDSDDLWVENDKLARQFSFLETHTDHALIGAAVIVIDVKGNEMKRFQNPQTDEMIKKTLLSRNTFAHSSVMYRKQAAMDLGGYDLNLNGIEDYDLWLKLGTKHKLANLPSFDLKYRVHGSNISLTDRLRLMATNLKLIKTYRHYYPNYFTAYLRRFSRYVAYRLLSFFN